MSKYIKLEDAIEQVKTEFYGGGYQEWLEISIDNLINRIANLPTIEVSGDCISREYLKSFEYINKGDFNSVETIREWIDNAPSVVPQTQIETQNLNENSNGDAISREYVKGICEMMLDEEMLEHMLGYIEDAPSVVPSRAEMKV